MANEKQAEAQQATTKKVVFVDPFTGIKAKEASEVIVHAQDVDHPDILGLELDKETGNTVVVSTGKRDIHREIQEFKNDCGFEGMKNLIAQGKATPRDFYDDGKHGQDVANLPDNVNDAFRAAMAASQDSGNLFADLGIKPVYNRDGSIDQEATEKALTDAINKKFSTVKVDNKEQTDGKAE